MASAALRGLVESQTLEPTATGWSFDETSAAPQWSHQAATVLARRLDLVSPPTQELLSVGAILGKEFSFDLAITLARLRAHDAAQAIREAQDRRLLWTDRDGAVGTFAHDRLREAFLQRITPERRAALHLEAAQRMEASAPQHVFELAYHFDAAGHSDRALPFAIEAARTARSRHLLEVAEVNYRSAERGVGGDPALRQHIATEFGQILMLRGQYEQAAQRLQSAASLAQDSLSRAGIEGQLGELAFKAGDVEVAARRLEHGLRVLGERLPRSALACALGLVWEIVVQLTHMAFGRRTRSRQPEGAVLTAHLYGRLTYAWWFGRRNITSLWALVRQLNVAERLPETPELGHAYAIHAVALCAMFPLFWRRGLKFTGRARTIAQRHGDLWGEGQAKSFEAVVLHGAAKYADAILAADEAVALLDRAGDPWERNTALWHKGLAAYRLGRPAEAIETAEGLYRTGQRLGDSQSHGIGLEIWAKASNGRIPAPPIESALEGSRGDGQTMSALLRADGVRLLAEGKIDDALERFQTAVDLTIGAGTRNVYVVSSLAWLATGWRQAAEVASPLSPANAGAGSGGPNGPPAGPSGTPASGRTNVPTPAGKPASSPPWRADPAGPAACWVRRSMSPSPRERERSGPRRSRPGAGWASPPGGRTPPTTSPGRRRSDSRSRPSPMPPGNHRRSSTWPTGTGRSSTPGDG
jgi:two-component system sensor kinase